MTKIDNFIAHLLIIARSHYVLLDLRGTNNFNLFAFNYFSMYNPKCYSMAAFVGGIFVVGSVVFVVGVGGVGAALLAESPRVR
jgi:hypothetical protein